MTCNSAPKYRLKNTCNSYHDHQRSVTPPQSYIIQISIGPPPNHNHKRPVTPPPSYQQLLALNIRTIKQNSP